MVWNVGSIVVMIFIFFFLVIWSSLPSSPDREEDQDDTLR